MRNSAFRGGKALGELLGSIGYEEEKPEYRMIQTGYTITNLEFGEDGKPIIESMVVKPAYKRVKYEPPKLEIKDATIWNYMFKTGFYEYRREPTLYPEGWEYENNNS